MRRIRSAGSWLGALSLALALLGAAGSVPAAPIEQEIADEQARQAELLEAIQSADPARPGPLAAPVTDDAEAADPRIAAPSPAIRELPDDIFDRSDETIAAGTWGNREALRVRRLVLDADGDGHPELIRFVDPKTRELLRQEEDRNYDGVLDAWLQLERGAVASRVLDSNDDGSPDVFESYRDGRLVRRELDRDDDGVRDVFYRYTGDSLVEERHDANNDGVIDMVIVYQERLRVRAEEDVDRDGRMDLWTTYRQDGGRERVARVERDRRGQGTADMIEIFGAEGGAAVLLRREEDLDGDGEIDAVSFYDGGKLQRRQLRSDAAVPL